MKKLLLVIAVLFFSNAKGISQTNVNQSSSKIDIELLNEMSNSRSNDEMFPIIVMMSEQYDQIAMEQKTRFMDKKVKREYVINEMKRFTGELQSDVVRVMNEDVRGNSVKDFKQFWVFNGFSCKATKEIIEIIAARVDVAMVFSDKERQMIPEKENESQPVDNVRGNAWNVTKVNADDVWTFFGETGYHGDGVVVAVIDTGVNYNHTDIVNNMWDGGTTYPYHGYDFVNNDNDPIDDHGHGTHCAGTVAGYGTNGTQTGMAPAANIMALKVLAASGSGSDSNIVRAIEFALNNGADVLSLSLGASGVGGYWYYRRAFETVLEAGVPASVAAGNDGDELSKYPIPNNIGAPGNCPPPYLHPDQKDILPGGTTAVISVGATDQNDEHAYFTSVGPATWKTGTYIGDYNDYPYTQGSDTEIGLIRPDVAAPGYGITSLDYSNNTGYCNKSGTSMATPCNAGVIALMLQANPELTPRKIDSILEHTAVRCEGATKKSNYTGSGRIDAYAAVSAALAIGFGGDATNHFVGQLSEPSNWSESSNWAHNEKPDNTSKVLVLNDVVIDENVIINTLYINNTVNVTVKSGFTLMVTDKIQNLSGADGLVIESDAALKTNAENLQATVKRDIEANASKDDWTGKWHFLSSPVAAASVAGFVNNADNQDYDLYIYDETSGYWYNEKANEHSSANEFYTTNGTNFVPGRGYLASYGTDKEMSFSGVINAGEISIPVTAEGLRYTGFNLVGNPYPCGIDWDAGSGWTRAALGTNPYIWIYNDDVDQYGAYQLGNHGVGTNGVTNVIASCQGFFVKATNSGNLVIDNDVKTTATGVFRKEKNNKSISIKVEGRNGSDEVMMCLTDEGFNNAEKLYSRNEAVPSLYLKVDNEKYSIVNVAEDESVTIPLGFEPGTTGKFIISSNSNVQLIDNLTGNVTDLSSSSYEFIGSNADNADRFLIRISGDSEYDDFVYQNGDELIVSGNGNVQVIDCLGRVVINETVNNGRVNVSGLNTGVYIVRMNNRNQKIVVR